METAFSDIHSGAQPTTGTYDIVAQYVRPLGIPVVFGLPAGHEDPNVALYMGREVTVTVGETGAAIEF